MSRIFYDVQATMADEATAAAWLDWMRSKHLADVLAVGAARARVVRLDEAMTFAAQYEFPDRDAFESYLRDHAPRLRAEGLERFGADAITYVRRSGAVEFVGSPR